MDIYDQIKDEKLQCDINPLRTKEVYIRLGCTLCTTTIHASKQLLTHIYALPPYHHQLSELSPNSQGRTCTPKIVNFSNHEKTCQQPKEFLKK